MQFDGRETQLLCDLYVLDLFGVLDGYSLDQLCQVRTRCDGGPAAECLELGLLYHPSVVVHLYLQLDHVTTRWRTDHTRADVPQSLVHRPHIPRVGVVLYHLRMVHPGKRTHQSSTSQKHFVVVYVCVYVCVCVYECVCVSVFQVVVICISTLFNTLIYTTASRHRPHTRHPPPPHCSADKSWISLPSRQNNGKPVMGPQRYTHNTLGGVFKHPYK